MSNRAYNRESVPVGEKILLEVQFRDSASQPKDTDSFPTIEVLDSDSSEVVAATTSGIRRTGIGRYRYDLTVPTGFASGLWTDNWVGSVDGYSISSTFDFIVDSVGSITAIGSTIEPEPKIGDDPAYSWTRQEINNINILLKLLKSKVQNIKYDEMGNLCPVFSNDDLLGYLCASLAEFNATPTITAYDFGDPLVATLFSDVITQGAYLVGMAAKAVHEAGREFVLNDNGVTINPPPVSATITGMYNAQLGDYRAKLKEIKRNLRPPAIGIGAGSILAANPRVRVYRHLRERRIIF